MRHPADTDAAAAKRLLESMLLGAAPFGLTACSSVGDAPAMLASSVPARRATKIDPMVAYGVIEPSGKN